MKGYILTCLGLFLGGVFLFLIQLWTETFSAALFLKLMITDGALFVIAVVVTFLVRENRESEKIAKGDDQLKN